MKRVVGTIHEKKNVKKQIGKIDKKKDKNSIFYNIISFLRYCKKIAYYFYYFNSFQG